MITTSRDLVTIVPGITRSLGGVVPSDRAMALLLWDDGTRTAVHTRTVFGRMPVAGRGVAAVAVRDETLSLSRTHFEIGPGETGVVGVIDLGSTNGIRLRRAGEVHEPAPGEHWMLRRGDILEFGDRWARIEGVR